MKTSPQKQQQRPARTGASTSFVSGSAHVTCRSRQHVHDRPQASVATAAVPSSSVPAPLSSSVEFEVPVHPRVVASEGQDGYSVEEEYDILGLGQLMIDYAAAVDDDMLAALDVPKGGRRIVSAAEKASVVERLQGYNSQVSAGGSLANSLVGIAQLAAARERFLAPSHQHSSSNSTQSSSPQGSSTSSPSGTAGRQRRIRVAFVGCVGGSDALGEFGRAQMTAAGIDIVSVDDASADKAFSGSTTGTVMVFTTPDAQRSFLSSFSSEDRIHLTPALLEAVTKSRLLVVEGYLWELPGAAEVIPAVVRHARAVGTLVVLTAGDASVVQRHGAKVLETIQAGVDMFVSNVGEAQALQAFLQQQQQSSQQQQQQQSVVVAAAAAAEHLQQQQQQEMQLHPVLLDPQGSANLDGMWEAGSSSCGSTPDGSSSEGQQVACELAGVCPLVVVTDGSRGSYITALGQLIVVPPYWRSKAPVDTCGAGDAYCGAFLFAFLLGLDLHAMGHLAAKTASAVISRHGPQLLPQDADSLAGVPLGRCTLATQLMSGGSSSSGTGLADVQLQALELGIDPSFAASKLVQSASS